jgi:hypothetical protein
VTLDARDSVTTGDPPPSPPPSILDAPVRKLIRFGAGIALGFVLVAVVIYAVFVLLAGLFFQVVTTTT